MPEQIAMPQAKWPNKVLRYKITCPIQRMLVVKYEGQIDWDGRRHGQRIESGKALDAHVREVMLPAIRRWMDPDAVGNHYCKRLDLDKMLANPAMHIQEARLIRLHEGDESARRFLLDHINQQKQHHFEAWWDYLTRENPVYRGHPAFQYLVLRPVLESSNAKTTRSPLPVHAEAIAHVWDRIRSGGIDVRCNRLLNLLSDHMAFGNGGKTDGQGSNTTCRWVLIQRDEDDAASRLAALSQGSGWCVASRDMAEYYLEDSDFHLLLEGTRPKVALQLIGHEASELQGKNNEDPGAWWPHILLFARARGIRILHRGDQAEREFQSIRTEVAGALRLGAGSLGELLKEQPAKVHLLDAQAGHENEDVKWVVREAWVACIRTDPWCAELLPDWIESDEAVKRATIDALAIYLEADPRRMQDVPKAKAFLPEIIEAHRRGWIHRLVQDPMQWAQTPRVLKSKADVVEACKNGWMKLLQREPLEWSRCPRFVLKDPRMILTLKKAWLTLLQHEPDRWKEFQRMAGFEEAGSKADPTRWLAFFAHEDRSYSPAEKLKCCPPFLQQDPEVHLELKFCWIALLEVEPTFWDQCPIGLLSDPEVLVVLQAAWIKRLRQDTSQRDHRSWRELLAHPVGQRFWSHEFFLQNAEVTSALKGDWQLLLRDQPLLWEVCPETILQDLEVIQALKTGCLDLIRDQPLQWGLCPDFLQQDADLRDYLKSYWLPCLQDEVEPWLQARCPDFILQDAEAIHLIRASWIKRLRQEPWKWRRCPEFLRYDPELVQVWLLSQKPTTRALSIRRLMETGRVKTEDLPQV